MKVPRRTETDDTVWTDPIAVRLHRKKSVAAVVGDAQRHMKLLRVWPTCVRAIARLDVVGNRWLYIALVALPASGSDEALAALHEVGVTAARRIGRVCEPDGQSRLVFE